MDSQDVIQAIDHILPDPKIFEDVNNMLQKYRASGQKKVQLEDEDISVAIPEGVQIDIVTQGIGFRWQWVEFKNKNAEESIQKSVLPHYFMMLLEKC
jgi:hypothetical protein